jgi:hypothetical protein
MRTIRGRERRVAFAYPAYRDSGVGARVSCVLFVESVGSMPLQFHDFGFHVEIHAIEWHDFQRETQFHGVVVA